MNYQTLTKGYMVSVVICGLICLASAIVWVPLDKIDLQFLVLVCFTIGLGSRVTVQIPQFKSHISVSDTFIFLTVAPIRRGARHHLGSDRGYCLIVAVLYTTHDGLVQRRDHGNCNHCRRFGTKNVRVVQ
jgi:hypothetical protein